MQMITPHIGKEIIELRVTYACSESKTGLQLRNRANLNNFKNLKRSS